MDFGTLKGFDINAVLSRYKNISLRLAYSLGYARGTGSYPESNEIAVWYGVELPSIPYPLDFDQRHKIAFSLDYRIPKDGGPTFLGRKVFSNAGINLVFNGGSGFPYTPVKQPNSLIFFGTQKYENAGPLNSSYGPWMYDINVKANKIFSLTGRLKVNAYIWVLNLTDRLNPCNVYETTGDWRTTGWLETSQGKEWLAIYGEEGKKLYEEVTRNPLNFRPPRQMRFGLEFLF